MSAKNSKLRRESTNGGGQPAAALTTPVPLSAKNSSAPIPPGQQRRQSYRPNNPPASQPPTPNPSQPALNTSLPPPPTATAPRPPRPPMSFASAAGGKSYANAGRPPLASSVSSVSSVPSPSPSPAPVATKQPAPPSVVSPESTKDASPSVPVSALFESTSVPVSSTPPASEAAPRVSAVLDDPAVVSSGVRPPSVASPSSSSTNISELIGSKVMMTHLTTIYEGILQSIEGEGPNDRMVIMRNVRDITMPPNAFNRQMEFLEKDVSGVRKALGVGTTPPGSAEGAWNNGGKDGFRTDTDISRSTPLGQERPLQPWSNDAFSSGGGGDTDLDTFGSGPSLGGNHGSKKTWDQFAENEKRFGTRSDFDEELYTTRLDRSGKDFREKERRAERLANEILGTASSNPHLQEERNQAVQDTTLGEEDRYSGVLRSANAYVPPNARRPSAGTPPIAPSPKPILSAVPPASSGEQVKTVTFGLPKEDNQGKVGETPIIKLSSFAGEDSPNVEKSALSAFHDFVKSDRQRLEQKRKQLDSKAKTEKDKRLKELVKFGQDFKLKTAIPSDLVPILAKDTDKQKAIIEKAAADAQAAKAKAAARESVSAAAQPLQVQSPAARNAIPKASPRGGMVLADIPPFNPAKSRAAAAAAATSGAPQAALGINASTPASPSGSASSSQAAAAALAKLNANAPTFVFKPNPSSVAFNPSTPTKPAVREIPPFHGTPKPQSSAQVQVAAPQSLQKPALQPTVAPTQPVASTSQSASAPSTPNPFFGTKPLKRSGLPVNVREDFNPHRLSKLSSPASYPFNWSFPGTSYKKLFPSVFTMPEPEFYSDNGAHLGMGGGNSTPHLGSSPGHLHAHPQHPQGQMYSQGGYSAFYPQYRFNGPMGQPPMPLNAAAGSFPGNQANGFAHSPMHPSGFPPQMFPNGSNGGNGGSGREFQPQMGAQGGAPPYSMGPVMVGLPLGAQGIYTPHPGYGQPQGFVNGAGRNAPMGYYQLQPGQMISPQMGHVYPYPPNGPQGGPPPQGILFGSQTPTPNAAEGGGH